MYCCVKNDTGVVGLFSIYHSGGVEFLMNPFNSTPPGGQLKNSLMKAATAISTMM